jgi:hypothetical protein
MAHDRTKVHGVEADVVGHEAMPGLPARRIYSDAQAGATQAKFRRCTHPFGCDHTGPILQTDHVVEHEDGGLTDVSNAAPLDGPHNRWKTNTKHGPRSTVPVTTANAAAHPAGGDAPTSPGCHLR